jgi:Transposase DDE domain
MKNYKNDIYNFILKKLKKVLKFNSNNSKYTPKLIFDSLIYILKSNISWNSKIIIDNQIILTNSIYKHFLFLTKIDFFTQTLRSINKFFFKSHINNSSYCTIDSTFIANKNCNTKCYPNLKRNKYKSNKFGFKISVITNSYNIPIDILFDNGNFHDLTILNKQLNKVYVQKIIKDKPLLADKGYKSNKLKTKLEIFNSTILLPKSNNKLYKKRIYIEHLFARLKNYKRISFIFDKKLTNFKSFCLLAFLNLYIIGYIKK